MFGLWMLLIICIVTAFGFLYASGMLKPGAPGRKANVNVQMPDLSGLKKFALPIAVFVIAGILLSGSFYSVSEDQQAVVTTFGKVTRTDSAGVHFKLPLVQHVTKVDVTTHGASIGYVIENSNQGWGEKENPQMITSDFNLIDVDFYIEYKVNDPVAYLYNSENPELILNNEAMSSIRGIISDYKVDDVMSLGDIEAKVKAFGWETVVIDGHNFDEIEGALKAFEANKGSGKPFFVIAKTHKGKGVSFMTDDPGWHGCAPKEEQYNIAVEELDAKIAELEG